MSDTTYFPLNLTVVQGDDVPMQFVFSQDSVPVDITTWDFFYTVKSVLTGTGDTGAVVALDPSDMAKSASIPAGTVDTLTFNIPHTLTAAMVAGTYYQDLQRVLAGLVTTLGKGQFVVEEQVTQRTVETP